MPEPQAGRTLAPGNPGADRHWLAAAIDLSRRCSPSRTAFSVGAILVGAAGEVIATGYSREVGPMDHAEEVALGRAAGLSAGRKAQAQGQGQERVRATRGTPPPPGRQPICAGPRSTARSSHASAGPPGPCPARS